MWKNLTNWSLVAVIMGDSLLQQGVMYILKQIPNRP